MAHVITDANFAETLNTDKLVVVDFWATWCGPCQMIAPILDEIAEECPDITVGKIDVDKEQDLAMSFGITSIPTLIVIKNGKAVDKAIGMRAKNQIIEMIDNA